MRWWWALGWSALALLPGVARADEVEPDEEPVCELNDGDVAHGWFVPLPGCPRSFHFDLPVDFTTTKWPGEVRTRFGAEVGYHWAIDERRRIYVGPVVAVTGSGLTLDASREHRLDNWRVAPQVNLRGFVDWWLAVEGSLGPVLDVSRGPDGAWYRRPAAQLTFGPRILGVLQLRAGYEWVPPGGPLAAEGRYILGANITLGGALIGGALVGIAALCAEGIC